MKIGGVDPKTLPREEILVLPRGDKEIVFRATGIPDYDEFEALCPLQKPPGVMTPDGWRINEDAPDYKAIVEIHNKKRLAWMVIHSLEPSKIEWDTVDLKKPSTWTKWTKDMKEAGISQVECNRITQLVFQANSLDEERLKEARANFLRGQALVPSEFSGPSTEPASTPSGKPASE